MSIGYLRTSEDVDAPVLIPTKGSMIALLDAVLVNGYGSTPALGYTKEFAGTNKAVYRQNGGTRTFIQVDHNEVGYLAIITGFESMIDVDTGLFPCPSEINTAKKGLAISESSSGNPCPWKILGDNAGFWFLNLPEVSQNPASVLMATAMHKVHYYGDYIPGDHDNTQYNFCILRPREPTYTTCGSWYFMPLSNIGGSEYNIMRPVDRTPGSIPVGLSSGSAYETLTPGFSVGFCDAFSLRQITTILTLHTVDGEYIGGVPGVKNSLSKYNHKGSAIAQAADLDEMKPELTFDHGDYIEHFYRVVGGVGTNNQNQAAYMVFIEGKGFRNVI